MQQYSFFIIFNFLISSLSSTFIKGEPADLVTWYFIFGLRGAKFCPLLKSLRRVDESLCLKAEGCPWLLYLLFFVQETHGLFFKWAKCKEIKISVWIPYLLHLEAWRLSRASKFMTLQLSVGSRCLAVAVLFPPSIPCLWKDKLPGTLWKILKCIAYIPV